jgi:hypothetical protein
VKVEIVLGPNGSDLCFISTVISGLLKPDIHVLKDNCAIGSSSCETLRLSIRDFYRVACARA